MYCNVRIAEDTAILFIDVRYKSQFFENSDYKPALCLNKLKTVNIYFFRQTSTYRIREIKRVNLSYKATKSSLFQALTENTRGLFLSTTGEITEAIHSVMTLTRRLVTSGKFPDDLTSLLARIYSLPRCVRSSRSLLVCNYINGIDDYIHNLHN